MLKPKGFINNGTVDSVLNLYRENKTLLSSLYIDVTYGIKRDRYLKGYH